jgi:Protein of unknown function (DUF3987)
MTSTRRRFDPPEGGSVVSSGFREPPTDGRSEPLTSADAGSVGSVGSPAVEPFPEPPIPLADIVCSTPFPVDRLPDWLAEKVQATAVATQTDPGLGGTVLLGALAAAAGGCAVVQMRSDWIEPLNLFTAPAAEPGVRKSAVFRAMFRPLEAAERELIAKTAASRWEAQVELEVAQATAEKAKKTAAVIGPQGDAAAALSEAHTAYARAQEIRVPPEPRLLADDATPEAITSLLADHGGRIAVVSAEGGLLDTLAGGRYSKLPNIEPLLKGHAGDRIRVDRKSRGTELVEHPALTLCLTLQPYMVRKLGTVGEFVGRGLLARFLFAVPPDTVGYRDADPPPVPEPVERTYATTLQALAETCHGWDEPKTLTLSPQAAALHLAAVAELEPRLRRDGDLYPLRDWASKSMGMAARVAGLLHLATHGAALAAKLPICERTMAAALALGDYFTDHAKVAFACMGSDPATANAREVLAFVRARYAADEKKTDTWKISELHRALPHKPDSRFAKVETVVEALDVLEEHRYAVRLPNPARQSGAGGRPPSPQYRFRLP